MDEFGVGTFSSIIKGYFGNFLGFEGIFIIFWVLGVFWYFYRFWGLFWSFFGFWDILVIFLGFESIFVIFWVLGVFW